jgi:hypothetical protein
MTGNTSREFFLAGGFVFQFMGFLCFFILFSGHVIFKNGSGVISKALQEYVD